MTLTGKLRFAVLALTACTLPAAISASTVISQTYSGAFPGTISGTLPNQGTALEETITLPAMSNLTVFTTSYSTGGFEPNLVLFNSTGNFVAVSGTPGASPVATPDPTTGMALDGYLTASGLAAGQYTIALTDWELNQSTTATNLSDGFTSNYGDGTNFIDQNGNTRTGNYSLTADVSQTPEPATLLLVAPLFVIFGLIARKHTLSPK